MAEEMELAIFNPVASAARVGPSVNRRIELLDEIAHGEAKLADRLARRGQKAYAAIRACREVEHVAHADAAALRRALADHEP